MNIKDAIGDTMNALLKTEVAPQHKCQDCGQSFGAITILSGKQFIRPTCDDCISRSNAESERKAQAEKRAERKKEWDKICPPLYLATDIDDQRLDAGLVAAVKAWNPESGRGLGLGSHRSGIGKTRLMYWRLQQLHMEGVKILAVTHTALCDYFTASACGELDKTTEKRRYHKPKILFIDDLGKGRFTESQQTALFDLLEHRTGLGLVTCFTTNSTGDQLKSKLHPDTADAMLRRIGSEFNDVFAV